MHTEYEVRVLEIDVYAVIEKLEKWILLSLKKKVFNVSN